MQERSGNKRGALGIGAALITVGLATAYFLREQRKISLSGKVVLITGSSRGLGLILARLLAAEGAIVALCARDAEELERARIDLLSRGVRPERIFARICDVTVPSQVLDMIQAVHDRFGRLDILINNAGIIQTGPMEAQTDADYEEALQIHFWGPHHFVQAALPYLKATRGRIVNISSIGGIVHFPHLLPYATSKAALLAYSQGLRSELQKDGVLVTTVAPGLMRTGSPQNAKFKGQHRKEYTWFALADSLPGSSQSADVAAQQIVEAMRYGDAFLVTSTAGKAGAFFSGLFPGLTADLLALADRFLPPMEGPESVGTESRAGRESETAITRSPLTALTREAAAANNEDGANPPSATIRKNETTTYGDKSTQ